MPSRKRPARTASRRGGECTPDTLGRQAENPNYSGLFGKGFAAFRKARGYTQAEVAKMIGRSESAIGEWERGESSPSIAQLARIARVMKCPITVLVAASFGEAKTYRQTLIKCLSDIQSRAHEMGSLLDGDLDHEELPRRWVAERRGKYGKMA